MNSRILQIDGDRISRGCVAESFNRAARDWADAMLEARPTVGNRVALIRSALIEGIGRDRISNALGRGRRIEDPIAGTNHRLAAQRPRDSQARREIMIIGADQAPSDAFVRLRRCQHTIIRDPYVEEWKGPG